MPFRSKNAVVTFKIETTPGVENAPAASTDAVLVENPRATFNPNILQTNEVTGSLDGFGPIVGGMTVGIAFDVLFKGQGAAATPPEFGDMLKACGYSETITTTAVPAAPEALAADGSTTTAILGTSASTTAQIYRGMPINFTGAVAGNSFIADYTTGKLATLTDTLSGALIATSNYQIPANVTYRPGSTSIPAGTLYMYVDGLLYKFVGMRGNVSFSMDSGGIGRFSFNMLGMFLSKTDTAIVTPTYDATRPVPFKNAVLKLDRLARSIQNLSFDSGNSLVNPDNPNALEGFDPTEITNRNITGTINPMETNVSAQDTFTAFRNNTPMQLHARLGSSAGNRMGITFPKALFTGHNHEDRSGLFANQMPFSAIGPDAGVHICFY